MPHRLVIHIFQSCFLSQSVHQNNFTTVVFLVIRSSLAMDYYHTYRSKVIFLYSVTRNYITLRSAAALNFGSLQKYVF